MSNAELATQLIYEARDLLLQAKDLLQAKPDVARPVTLEQPKKLQVSSELQTLLNDWIKAHDPKRADVHDWHAFCELSDHMKTTFMSSCFFRVAKDKSSAVCKWLLKTQKCHNVMHWFDHVATQEYPPFVCKVLKDCDFSPNRGQIAHAYAVAAFKWAIIKADVDLLHFLKDWGFSQNDTTELNSTYVELAAQHGNITVLQFFKDVLKMTAIDASSRGDNAVLRAAVKNGHTATATFLTTWIFG